MKMPTDVDDLNAKMVKFAPELASEYARYPLCHTCWLNVTEKDHKGEPCYISSTNTGLKMHYVYGPGPKGFGYYHLLTKQSCCMLE